MPDLAVRVRPVGPDDDAFLAALHASTRPELAGLPDVLALQRRAQQAAIQALVPTVRVEVLLDAAGRPVGRIVVQVGPPVWRVVDVAVLPAARGRGTAAAALRAVQEEARACPDGAVVLQVLHGSPALRLYGRLGFVETGRDALRAELRWSA